MACPADPQALAQSILQELEANADPLVAAGQQNYFRETARTVGVRGDFVKEVAARTARTFKTWSMGERIACCEELWRDGRIESGGVVCHALRRFARHFGAAEFGVFERWIDDYITNWATCDGVSTWLLAGCIANEAELAPRLVAWTESENRWKRRAAAVSLVPAARHAQHLELILEIAARLRSDGDDMVRKGLGWLLKDAWPKHPAAVSVFLKTHRDALPKLVVRIAMEKMTPEARIVLKAD